MIARSGEYAKVLAAIVLERVEVPQISSNKTALKLRERGVTYLIRQKLCDLTAQDSFRFCESEVVVDRVEC